MDRKKIAFKTQFKKYIYVNEILCSILNDIRDLIFFFRCYIHTYIGIFHLSCYESTQIKIKKINHPHFDRMALFSKQHSYTNPNITPTHTKLIIYKEIQSNFLPQNASIQRGERPLKHPFVHDHGEKILSAHFETEKLELRRVTAFKKYSATFIIALPSFPNQKKFR